MPMKKTISVILAVLLAGSWCYGQIASGSKFNYFQISAAGGVPSREKQVKGPLHQYTATASVQYDENTLYGFYGPGGYYPSVGATLGFYHYDRASYPQGTPYSNHYSLSLHYEQTLWSSGRFSACYFLENGMGYTQDCYDLENNPESTFGGHFHIAFQAGAFFSWQVSDHYRLSIGPAYSHHSNARTNVVNTGCDAVSAEIALTYLTEPVAKRTEKVTREDMGLRKHNWDIKYGACITGAGNGDLSQSWVYASHMVSVAHFWRAFRRASLGVGADAFFDKGGHEDRNSFGFAGNMDFFLTRNIILSLKCGRYMNGRSSNGSFMYESVGMNYSIDASKWYLPYLGFSVKANGSTAEHLELVLGFRV